MKKNDMYFLKRWCKTLLIISPIIFIFIWSIFESPKNIKQLSISIIVAMVFIYFIRKDGKKSIDKCFQCETSNQIIGRYDKIMNSRFSIITDKDAFLMYLKSLAFCYYGEFDKVDEMLEKVKWKDRSPYIQSLEISLKALRCYLDFKDYKEGLRLSVIAKELGDTSDKIPGSTKTKDFYETYIQVGELLNGNIQNSVIESLEIKSKKAPIFVKILILYCLSKVYTKLDLPDKAKEKIDHCKRIAPYCKPLYT